MVALSQYVYNLNESLSGESMALNVVSKINTSLKFLYREKKFVISIKAITM